MSYYTVMKKRGLLDLESYVCFSNNFRHEGGFYDFKLYLLVDFDQENISHDVILDNKDINLFIRTVNREFGGIDGVKNVVLNKLPRPTFDILDTDHPEERAKEISISLNKCKGTTLDEKKHAYKIVCTYMRYLYEYDFNEMLARAIAAYRKNKKFHLFTYLYNAHKGQSYNSYHAIGPIYLGAGTPSFNDKFKLGEGSGGHYSIDAIYKYHQANSQITNKKDIKLIKDLLK